MIALDGKIRAKKSSPALRGSFDHINDKKAAQTLTAFASSSAILLAHTPIDEKSNESGRSPLRPDPAAQQMIGELGLTGVIFTADAMHCQKNV